MDRTGLGSISLVGLDVNDGVFPGSQFLTFSWRITATYIRSAKSNKLDPRACARYPAVTCDFRFRLPQLLHVARTDLFGV